LTVLSDIQIVGRAILPTMMAVTINGLQSSELKVCSDVFPQINVAAVVPFKGLDPLTMNRCVSRTEKEASSILNGAGAEDTRVLLIALCQLCCKLVDEGMHHNIQSMEVLHSLMILEEVKEKPEIWGPTFMAPGIMGKILDRVILAGYFTSQSLLN
jgi:hypothetical protein